MTRTCVTLLFLAAGLAGPAAAGEPTPSTEIVSSAAGSFSGALSERDFDVPVVDEDGWEWRRLREEFAFVDAEGRRWVAPAGAVVNGASIPGPLRQWVGEPWDWEAGYVEASVIHDVYCTAPYDTTVASGEVHRMFYDACRARGVPRWRAGLMYAAVWTFGPRWEVAPSKPEALAEGS